MENTWHSLIHAEPCLLQRDNVSFVRSRGVKEAHITQTYYFWRIVVFSVLSLDKTWWTLLTFTTLMISAWHQVNYANSWKANLWSLDVIAKSFLVAGKYLTCDGRVNFWLTRFPSKLWQLSPFLLKTMENAEGFSWEVQLKRSDDMNRSLWESGEDI